MKTEFYKDGNKLTVVTADVSTRLNKLEPKVYRIEKNESSGYVLEIIKESFHKPKKLFGKKTTKLADIILGAFVNSTTAVGAMAVGAKGCGKSQQVELICNNALERHGYPVLVIDEPLPKKILESAIKAASPCVIYIDEYEKLYKPEYRSSNKAENVPDENELLTLFSDKSLGKALILITANRVNDLSPYMLNRPERFLFRLEYSGTDKDVVQEICDHYKLTKDIKEYICDYAEDTRANVDTCITLAVMSSQFTKATQLKELFSYLNVIKPKQWAWVIYTESGEAAGIEVETDRKNITITDTETKKSWIVNYDDYHKKFQYNQNYRCFTLVGVAGASDNIKLGFLPAPPVKAEEGKEAETVQFFQLTKNK